MQIFNPILVLSLLTVFVFFNCKTPHETPKTQKNLSQGAAKDSLLTERDSLVELYGKDDEGQLVKMGQMPSKTCDILSNKSSELVQLEVELSSDLGLHTCFLALRVTRNFQVWLSVLRG